MTWNQLGSWGIIMKQSSKFSIEPKIHGLFFSEMRTARNMFIATLAISDLTLCLFTVPMTLADILTKYWPFGINTGILCKVCLFLTIAITQRWIFLVIIFQHTQLFNKDKNKTQKNGFEMLTLGVVNSEEDRFTMPLPKVYLFYFLRQQSLSI